MSRKTVNFVEISSVIAATAINGPIGNATANKKIYPKLIIPSV